MDNLFFHSNTNPRVTIAGKVEDDIISISAARCSKKDQFEKKKGRLISSGRLNKGHSIVFEKDNSKSINQQFVELAKKVSKEVAENKILV